MKTVNEVAKLTNVSVRTLHHYHRIGLLKPTRVTEAGYRLYDDAALERLYLILLFREIGFPLKQIQSVLDAPDFDRNRVLEKQIDLLKAKIDHLQSRIYLAKGIKLIGVKYLEFEGWDPKKIDDYQAQAKALYGKSEPYREFVEKSKNRTPEQSQALGDQVMALFTRLGKLKDRDPADAEVQAWVKELQEFFTQHFYTCTPQLLLSLSEGYAGGGSMNENIDAAGGKGTGEFARQAIEIYCQQ